MSQNSRLNGLSSLPATGVPLGGNIRKPVLARETRREALGERSLETMRAQRGCAGVFGDELHQGLRFGREFGMAPLQGAALRRVVDVGQAEAPAVAGIPFEIIDV